MGEEGPQVAPEVLKSKADGESAVPAAGAAPGGDPSKDGGKDGGKGDDKGGGLSGDKRPKWMKRGSYRPSHKATFIGIAVVAAILGINAAVIGFVVTKQQKEDKAASGNVTISADALDKVGINRSSAGTSGVELIVNPNAKFGGKVQVGGELTVAGQFKTNGTITSPQASLAKLEAGDTSVTQLNVNGNGTITSMNVRNDLIVAGISRLQGEVVVTKLLTVNNNVTVTGSLSVGGALTVQQFQTSKLTVDTTLTIGGHIITRGLAPSIALVGSLGSAGTTSISGNDAAGSIALNVGAGGSPGGSLVSVTFRTPYATTPRVVASGVGAGMGGVYVFRSATGFTIGLTGTLPPGGYAVDYIVMQ